jgi:hypothetical protein
MECELKKEPRADCKQAELEKSDRENTGHCGYETRGFGKKIMRRGGAL